MVAFEAARTSDGEKLHNNARLPGAIAILIRDQSLQEVGADALQVEFEEAEVDKVG